MKKNIIRLITAILLLSFLGSCGPDYFLKRNKFYKYKKHWHRRWARPMGHYGSGYF